MLGFFATQECVVRYVVLCANAETVFIRGSICRVDHLVKAFKEQMSLTRAILHISSDVVWCNRCGSFAASRVDKLGQPCSGEVGGQPQKVRYEEAAEALARGYIPNEDRRFPWTAGIPE